MNAIEKIRELIAPTLELFNKSYAEQLHSVVPLLNEINAYLLERSGKQIRPLLVLTSAEADLYGQTGEAYEKAMATKIQLALAMEILHNSSLMHDDVVDESPLRRGRETVRQKWSNKIAVLCGDFYLAQVMNILNEINDRKISAIVDNTVIEMSEGELLQQQVSRTYDVNRDHYFSVIHKKTASLMASCCEIGCSKLKEYGEQFGMAFQIRDDILDYHPERETGKPCGNDIRERKMTLPLLCYLSLVDEAEQQWVKKVFEQDSLSDEEVNTLVEKVWNSGALDEAKKELHQRITKAQEALNVLVDSPYKSALFDLSTSLELN